MPTDTSRDSLLQSTHQHLYHATDSSTVIVFQCIHLPKRVLTPILLASTHTQSKCKYSKHASGTVFPESGWLLKYSISINGVLKSVSAEGALTWAKLRTAFAELI